MPEAASFVEADWPAPPWVRAGTTTRVGGVSRGPYASLNLADHVGDQPEAVARNRQRLREALQLPAEPCWLRQQHGAGVVEATPGALPQADAALAGRPHQVCVVLTADCLPILLCDPVGARVAAIHAGWRGIHAGVIEATVASLGSSGQLLAWLGPGISAPCYPVGAELRAELVPRRPPLAGAFRARAGGGWLFDLAAASRLILGACGVFAVSGGEHCTLRDERFFSHRRDGPTGRMASLIWMLPR